MPKNDYIKQNDQEFAVQTKTFADNIGPHATLLGLTPAQLAQQAADSAYINYVGNNQQAAQKYAQQWTAWRDLFRDGGQNQALSAPTELVLAAVVPAVAPGIEARFRALVKLVKASAGYSVAIGEALGIEGTVHAAPDLNTLQPQFDVRIVGGQVFVDWTWQGYSQDLDSCELQVDRGDGKGYALLAEDTTPGYTDTTALPAAPTKWIYRAIFRVGEQRVGLWSLPVSITVSG